jgi:hypothetical protein
LEAIVEDVLAVLKQTVWLPYVEDYAILALTVPVTYLRSVFESVPLLLLNGPAASGKTLTGNAMAKLCANGTVIGQVSAASAIRLIDKTRGFVVIDDVKSIAAKSGKDAQMSEFMQALKVSYNQQTAIKVWMDTKTMRPEKLNLFGVKMLINPVDTDPILGSQMIRIQTRLIPPGTQAPVSQVSSQDLSKLRNELQVWAFESVQTVEQVYREIYARRTDRMAEIAAPLRTIAQICGDPEITAKLEVCLARQQAQQESFGKA